MTPVSLCIRVRLRTCHIGAIPPRAWMACCLTSASLPHSWMWRNVDSVFVMMVLWTCAWTISRARVPPIGLRMLQKKKLPTCCGNTAKKKLSRKIARTIVERRVETPLLRTAQLADLIASVVLVAVMEKSIRRLAVFRPFVFLSIVSLKIWSLAWKRHTKN